MRVLRQLKAKKAQILTDFGLILFDFAGVFLMTLALGWQMFSGGQF